MTIFEEIIEYFQFFDHPLSEIVAPDIQLAYLSIYCKKAHIFKTTSQKNQHSA